jgi:hypothetical protein
MSSQEAPRMLVRYEDLGMYLLPRRYSKISGLLWGSESRFHLFPRLPLEIQDKIWEESLEARVIPTDITIYGCTNDEIDTRLIPLAFQICGRSRAIGLAMYERTVIRSFDKPCWGFECGEWDRHHSKRWRTFYVDPDRDVFAIPLSQCVVLNTKKNICKNPELMKRIAVGATMLDIESGLISTDYFHQFPQLKVVVCVPESISTRDGLRDYNDLYWLSDVQIYLGASADIM